MEGENYKNNRRLWKLDDKFVPEIITKYLKQLKEYLNIDKTFIQCLPNNSEDFDNTDILIISIPGLDYKTQSKLFKEFVKENGNGPFIEIHPSTFTGEYVEEPIISRTKTK